MTSKESAQPAGLDEIQAAWAERCSQEGADPAACQSLEARFVLSALARAVVAGAETRELGRAARGWGDRFSSPVEALACLSCLREVVVHSAGAPTTGWAAAWLPVSAEAYNRVVDQLTSEAVDSASANLRAAARTDPLTGCANRLALNEDLERAISSARRSKLDFSVAMIDLDGLKQINDGRGHEAGDLALVALAGMLQGVLRGADRLYRIGGDEFVVMLPFTDAAGAETMLRRAETMHGPSFSWGVASLKTVGEEALARPELLLSAADAALYAGRAERRSAPVLIPPASVATPRVETAVASRRRRTPIAAPVIGGLAAALLALGTALGIVIPLGVGTPSALHSARSGLHSTGTLPAISPPSSTTPTSPTSPPPAGSHPSPTTEKRPSPPQSTGSAADGGTDLDRSTGASSEVNLSGSSGGGQRASVGRQRAATPRPGTAPPAPASPKQPATKTPGTKTPVSSQPGAAPKPPTGPAASRPSPPAGRVPPALKRPPGPGTTPSPPAHRPPAASKPAAPPSVSGPPPLAGRRPARPPAPSRRRPAPARPSGPRPKTGPAAQLMSHLTGNREATHQPRSERGPRRSQGGSGYRTEDRRGTEPGADRGHPFAQLQRERRGRATHRASGARGEAGDRGRWGAGTQGRRRHSGHRH